MGDKRNLLATLEQFAGVVRVNAEIHILEVNAVGIRNASRGQEGSFVGVARVIAPHGLEVGGTDGTVVVEYGVECIVVCNCRVSQRTYP